jgi:cytochrome c biogenesis protein
MKPLERKLGMSKEKNALFRLLISVKLTLTLFLLLAAASVLGTVLPQGSAIFYSVWFKGLLLLLCANLVACTLDRLPKTIRLLNKPETHFDSRKLLKFSLNGVLATEVPLEKTRQVVQTAVKEALGPLSALESNGAWCAFSESGRWSRLMVHIAHLSVLVVLVGVLVGSLARKNARSSSRPYTASPSSVRGTRNPVRPCRLCLHEACAPRRCR